MRRMRQSVYPLSRARRLRAPRATFGGSALALCAAAVVFLIGMEERRTGLPAAPQGIEVATAQAKPLAEERPVVVRTERVQSTAEASDVWSTPLRTDLSPLPQAGAGEDTPPSTPASVEAPPDGEPRPLQPAAQISPPQPRSPDVARPAPPPERAVPTPHEQPTSRGQIAFTALFEPTVTMEPAPPLGATADETVKAVPAAPPAGPSFAGKWAGHRSACSNRNKTTQYLPLTLTERGAKAGGAACTFARTNQNGNRWEIAATCVDGDERWAANVRLVLNGGKLTWSSERGTQTYVRCR
jgi:hypothetical protein